MSATLDQLKEQIRELVRSHCFFSSEKAVNKLEKALLDLLEASNKEARIEGGNLTLSDIEAEIELNGYESIPEYIIKLRKLLKSTGGEG